MKTTRLAGPQRSLTSSSAERIFARADDTFWGLLTQGSFLLPAHTDAAQSWVEGAVRAVGSEHWFTLEVTRVLGLGRDGIGKGLSADAFRTRTVRLLGEHDATHLEWFVVTTARALLAAQDEPDLEPHMEGDSDMKRIGRVLWVRNRYFAGNAVQVSKAGGMDRSYVGQIISRGAAPSEDFLRSLALSAGLSSDWLLSGSGAPERR